MEGMGHDGADLGAQASAFIASASGVQLPVPKSRTSGRALTLEMLATPQAFAEATGLGAELFEQIGDQGYALVIDAKHVLLAARAIPGMRHAITTLGQIAADRTVLPGITICDWPSLKYRGAQQDISRGQVPVPATEYGPGDFFFMPAGHDAWIVGDKRCVMLDSTGVAKYAKKI